MRAIETLPLTFHADIDADTINAVLEEGGKFCSEVIAPINLSGDQEGCELDRTTHEVRTPLATIRTLIRSLLRRRDLTALVRQRLEQIDGECSEQIDRFGLIFLAAELQRRGGGRPATSGELARTDLAWSSGW